MDGLEDLPPGIGQYDDFHTIDWLRDISRDRMRHRHIVKRRQEGCFEKLKGAHDAWSGWVCVLLVGCAAGQRVCVFTMWESVAVLDYYWPAYTFCLWSVLSDLQYEFLFCVDTHHMDTLLKNINGDLTSFDMELLQARDAAQNRPFWRMLASYSAMHP